VVLYQILSIILYVLYIHTAHTSLLTSSILLIVYGI
jgi:hypothetical protein